MPPNFPKTNHPLLLKIALVVVGILLALLTLELYVRISQSINHIPIECIKSDDTLNHTLTPGKICPFKTSEWNIIYNINSLGFRDIERSIEKPTDTLRILMLGDSFTEGWGVEQNETFSNVLEINLNKNNPKNHFEVVNAGVGSYSPILEYLYLKEKGLTLQPDLVILNFDYSDFLDEKEYQKSTKYDENNLPVAVFPKPTTTLESLFKYGQKFNNHELTIDDRQINKFFYFLAKHSFVFRQFFVNQNISADNIEENFMNNIVPDLELPQKHLLLINNLLKDKNIKFMIVLYPYRYHLLGKIKTDYFDQLENFGRINEINVLNLLPIFKKQNPKKLYFKHDFHGTNKFHSLMAESIYNYLLQHNITTR